MCCVVANNCPFILQSAHSPGRIWTSSICFETVHWSDDVNLFGFKVWKLIMSDNEIDSCIHFNLDEEANQPVVSVNLLTDSWVMFVMCVTGFCVLMIPRNLSREVRVCLSVCLSVHDLVSVIISYVVLQGRYRLQGSDDRVTPGLPSFGCLMTIGRTGLAVCWLWRTSKLPLRFSSWTNSLVCLHKLSIPVNWNKYFAQTLWNVMK